MISLNELTISEHGWCRGCDWHQQCVLHVIIEGKARTSSGQQRIFHFTRRTVHVHCEVNTVCDSTDIRGYLPFTKRINYIFKSFHKKYKLARPYRPRKHMCLTQQFDSGNVAPVPCTYGT